jgi:hypothetical protein
VFSVLRSEVVADCGTPDRFDQGTVILLVFDVLGVVRGRAAVGHIDVVLQVGAAECAGSARRALGRERHGVAVGNQLTSLLLLSVMTKSAVPVGFPERAGGAAARRRDARFVAWSRSAASPVAASLARAGPPIYVMTMSQRAVPRLGLLRAGTPRSASVCFPERLWHRLLSPSIG